MRKEVKVEFKIEGFEKGKEQVSKISIDLQKLKKEFIEYYQNLENPPIDGLMKISPELAKVSTKVRELSQYTEKSIKLISTSLEKQIDQTQKSIKEYTEGGEKVKKVLKDQKKIEDELTKTYKEQDKANSKRYSNQIYNLDLIAKRRLDMKYRAENQKDIVNDKYYEGIAEKEEAHADKLKEIRKKLAEDIYVIDVEVQKKNKEFYDNKAQLIREAGNFEKAEVISKYNELLASDKVLGKEREDLIKRRNDHLVAIESETQRQITENKKEAATKNTEITTSSIEAILKQSEKAVMHGKKAAEESTEAVAKSVDTVAKKVEETKWDEKFKMKSVINVEATKQDVARVDAILKEYQVNLKAQHEKTFKDKEDALKKEIGADYQKSDEYKNLLKEKEAADKQYEAASKKISAAIVENDKRDNALRLQQVQAYAANAQAALEKGMDIVKASVDSTETMFKGLADIHKKNVELTDEKLKELDAKNKEYVDERNMREENIATLTKERMKAKIAGDQETMASLDLKISKEKEAFDKSKAAHSDYENEKKKLEEKKAKEKERQEKKERIATKIKLGREMAEAVINVAKGVTVALAKGPILGPILAAIVTAQGAIQLGIMTKQMTQLEDGGLLRGKRHSQGGMRIEGSNIEVEGGEYVVNRVSTQKNLGLIRYINSQRKELQADDLNTYFKQSVPVIETPFHNLFASGGQLPVSTTPSNVENEQLMDAIRSIKFSPKVAVTDIMRVQDEMTSVDGWAGL